MFSRSLTTTATVCLSALLSKRNEKSWNTRKDFFLCSFINGIINFKYNRMKFKSVFAAALLAMSATAASAQATYIDKNGDEYQFKKHAFLQLQGGAQHTVGEAKFSDLISPNVQVGVGYQFNPWFGARIAANAWQSKGGYNGVNVDGTNIPGNVTYKYNYVAPGLDFMFNLSNAFCGWNPKRVLNVTAFLGGAANIAWGNDEANDLAKKGYQMEYLWDGSQIRPVGRAGVGIDFRLSDAVALGIEGNANVTTDKYNSKKAGNADWYFNALVGLKINLGKTYKKIAKPAPVVEEPAPAPAPAPVVEEKPAPVKVESLRRDIFFVINKSIIRDEEMTKVKDVADYLAKYPDAKVTITGYADAGTGNNMINDRLAALRADAVVKALVQKFNVSRDRIVSDSKGSRIQPFADNDSNRVSICIAE